MKIKLISRMSGPDGNYNPGSVLDLNKEQAQSLINGGYAVSIDPEAIEDVVVVETAVILPEIETPEKPIDKKPKRR